MLIDTDGGKTQEEVVRQKTSMVKNMTSMWAK
jgi:hypothetical protein